MMLRETFQAQHVMHRRSTLGVFKALYVALKKEKTKHYVLFDIFKEYDI